MSRKRILIIAGIFVLLLILIDGGIYLATRGTEQPIVLNLNLPSKAESASPEPGEEQIEPMPVATPLGHHGILVDLGTKVVNLADPGGYRYLRVGLVLEFVPEDPEFYTLEHEEQVAAEESQLAEIEERKPMIEDVLIGLLSDSAFNDIFSIEGKHQLKEKLRIAINEKLGQEWVSHIYFTDFMIQ